MGFAAQFLVIRIGMYVNWCVIYPTQLTCLSLLIASYITHYYYNLVRFCCVITGLTLWVALASWYFVKWDVLSFITALFLVIRIGMYVNWCVIYPTQLTCLSLLMASYITHYANLIGFCSVSNGLLLWLSFFLCSGLSFTAYWCCDYYSSSLFLAF